MVSFEYQPKRGPRFLRSTQKRPRGSSTKPSRPRLETWRRMVCRTCTGIRPTECSRPVHLTHGKPDETTNRARVMNFDLRTPKNPFFLPFGCGSIFFQTQGYLRVSVGSPCTKASHFGNVPLVGASSHLECPVFFFQDTLQKGFDQLILIWVCPLCCNQPFELRGGLFQQKKVGSHHLQVAMFRCFYCKDPC